MKKYILSILAILIIAPIFSQDSTTVGGGSGDGLPSWFYIAGATILTVYEVLVRYIPTMANYSILGVIIKAIKAIVPNNKVGGGTLPE